MSEDPAKLRDAAVAARRRPAKPEHAERRRLVDARNDALQQAKLRPPDGVCWCKSKKGSA